MEPTHYRPGGGGGGGGSGGRFDGLVCMCSFSCIYVRK